MNKLVAYDPSKRIIVHETNDAARVLNAVPESKQLHNGYIASPATLFNLQMLTWLGLPVIKPMESDYDWPINPQYKPLSHQKQMANFMVLNPRCCNLSDPGTMKTLATLWAADYVMQHYPRGECRAIIVCTKSTMQRVWADAIFQNMLSRRTFAILSGSADRRMSLLKHGYDFYIINYAGLDIGAPTYNIQDKQWTLPTGLYKYISQRKDIKIAIIDEASAYRDSTNQRHKTARALLQLRDYLWLLTGTPCSKGPLGVFGLHKLIHPHGESFRSFRARTMFKLSGFKWLPLPGATEEAYKLLRPAIRYEISECVELPPCTTQFRDVELSPQQKKAYKQLKDYAQLLINNKEINAVNEAVVRTKLIQIACGAVYGPGKEIHRVDAKPRLQVVREIIEENDDKFIIFAPFRGVLYLLWHELKDFKRELIHGNVNDKERARIFDEFQHGTELRCLLADPGTMAHGLTLTAASFIIWYAPTDKTEIYLQANKRIDRPGQTKNTTIYQLAGSEIEREIYRRNEKEQSMQGLILKMVRDKRGEF